MLLSLILLFSVACRGVIGQETFTNPIFESNSADPCVSLVGDFYYLIISTDSEHEISIFKSSQLTNFRNTESKVIFTAPPGYSDVWASEMHEVDGELYIYFCMNKIGSGHRMYAIRANNQKEPMGLWSAAILLFPEDTWGTGGIDGTIMKHGNGRNYFVYSQFPRIVIAEMADALTPINATKVLLREPSKPWEVGVNEGPYFIYNQNVSYMVFGVGGSFDPSYALGLMSIPYDKDPMNTSNWWYGDDGPVFWKNEEEKVLGPGHAAFTTSPDGKETWFIYHAHENDGFAGGHRIARVEKITWADDGKPIFPRPHGYFNSQPVPSGQLALFSKETFTNPIISGSSSDPNVLLLGDTYYLTLSTKEQTEITIYQSKELTNFRNAPSKIVLPARDCVFAIWASEMHLIDGEVYLYLAYMTCENNYHSVYFMKALNPADPMGEWSMPTRLMPEYNEFAVDPTILRHGANKTLYLTFTSKADTQDGNAIYLAPMQSPTNVFPNSQVLIKSPSLEWEKGTNEGPSFIYNKNISYLVYSVGQSWGPDYALRMASVDGDKDPLVKENWWMGDEAPVFWKNEAESVFTTGQSGFTSSPDGSEMWMTYHASIDAKNIDGFKVARIEKVDFDSVTGKPIFPRPHGYFTSQSVPKGQGI